jgi:hypothetical protein
MSLPFSSSSQQSTSLGADLSEKDHAFVPASVMGAILEARGLRYWESFAASWDDLALDRYMADGGRYRRRRHAVFQVSDQRIERLPHQPHFQTLAHNPLNGGVARWFEPIEPRIAQHPAFVSVLQTCDDIFAARSVSNLAPPWHVEAHQFRIEASASAGKPTPEGMHRDGVDWVFVMLVGRSNIGGGETIIEDAGGQLLRRQALSKPLDAVFLDDRRILHGTTDISALDKGSLSFRDVLVVTFRRVRR